MGEFLDRVDVGEIVGRPVSAYADELVAAYYYTLTAYSVEYPL